MIFALKDDFCIPRYAVEVFVSLCKVCNLKKSQQLKGVVVRPITMKDFNHRGQVNLIDFQSTPYEGYKWLMNYEIQMAHELRGPSH